MVGMDSMGRGACFPAALPIHPINYTNLGVTYKITFVKLHCKQFSLFRTVIFSQILEAKGIVSTLTTAYSYLFNSSARYSNCS